jgi:hypothetical protein
MTHHRFTTTIALTLALAATVATAAPVASADPPPLTQTEAAIANHATPGSPATCGDVCSGHGYGSTTMATRSRATAALCGDVCSGHGYGSISAPATVVRVVAPGGGFDWGDAGIGAAAAIVLMLAGIRGVLAATGRRGRRAHPRQASASS